MDMMDIRKAITMIPVLTAANPASLAALINFAVLKHVNKGMHLYLDKDEVRNVYFIADGTAALYKLNDRSEKKVIFVYGTGSMLNEAILDARPSSDNCELLTDSWILSFDRQQFLYICEQDFRLAKAVMDSMSLKIRRLYRQMKNTGNSIRGDKRIASKLWKLSKDHGVPCDRGVMIGFDLTVTYLADMLGSKRETVSRQLKILSEKGLVITHKNRFIIPNRNELKKYLL